jgi:hypothetical protein
VKDQNELQAMQICGSDLTQIWHGFCQTGTQNLERLAIGLFTFYLFIGSIMRAIALYHGSSYFLKNHPRGMLTDQQKCYSLNTPPNQL